MPEVTVKHIVNAPLSEVWATWDDFGNIARLNPSVASSHTLPGSQPTGLGATRQCNLVDGKNHIRERITDYAPLSRMEIEIYEGTMPLKKATGTISMRPAGRDQTEVTMKMAFTPKFGLLGRMMVPMMKPQFRKMLSAMLEGNANYVEQGAARQAA